MFKNLFVTITAITVLFTISLFSQELRIKLTAKDVGNPILISETTFGWHVNATICKDTALGEREAPPPPLGFEIRFVRPRTTIPETCYPITGLFQLDLRNWQNGTTLRDTFRLNTYNLDQATLPVTISWVPISNSSLSTLTMSETITPQSINMLSSNSIVLDNADITFVRILATTILGVSEVGGVPTEYKLEQNYPNPFNPTTDFLFSLKNASNVKIQVYDVMGRLVTTLFNEDLPMGNFKATWDGLNDDSQSVSSGIYYVKLTAFSRTGELFTDMKKAILLK